MGVTMLYKILTRRTKRTTPPAPIASSNNLSAPRITLERSLSSPTPYSEPHPGTLSLLNPRASSADAERTPNSTENHQTRSALSPTTSPPATWTCHVCHVPNDLLPECWACNHAFCSRCLPGEQTRRSHYQCESDEVDEKKGSVSSRNSVATSSAATSRRSARGSSAGSSTSTSATLDVEKLEGLRKVLSEARAKEVKAKMG